MDIDQELWNAGALPTEYTLFGEEFMDLSDLRRKHSLWLDKLDRMLISWTAATQDIKMLMLSDWIHAIASLGMFHRKLVEQEKSLRADGNQIADQLVQSIDRANNLIVPE